MCKKYPILKILAGVLIRAVYFTFPPQGGGELYFTFPPPPGGGEIKMKFLNTVVLSYCSVTF